MEAAVGEVRRHAPIPGRPAAIDEVSPITVDEVTAADACSAGYLTPEDVIADLRPEGQLYRIRFRRVGDDPRIALRQQADVDEPTLAAVERLPWAATSSE